MFGNRLRWILLAVAVLVVAAVAGGTALWLRPGSAPTRIALVNADQGPTGVRIVKALQDSHSRDWVTAQPGASTADYAAVITLPADLSGSIGTLGTATPHRAQVTVASNRHADAHQVDDAVDEVTRRVGAAGVDEVLAAIATARGSVQQAAFTTQLLGAGVQAAAGASGEFSAGADQMLGFLDTAKSGAGELTAGIGQLNDALTAVRSTASGLAGALDESGLTLGQVTTSATQLGTGLDQAVTVLRALPFAADPQLTDVIGKLDALRGVANQAAGQLQGFAQLAGSSTDPGTPLATLLRDAVKRLDEAGTLLNTGAGMAGQIPQLADQGSAALVSAISQLTGGVQQLQQIVGNLNTQTGKALTALPGHSSSQQSAIAESLTDPVEIVRK
ncbi:hypothetical protein [Nocardia sp. BMG111209]|uniref:hypothetical protein n=1 Tax=Nocardia sp. BMG111209 TaxID=1160137 RepID=UPI00036C74E7|nr:hypothetical protein [Nocardia sp. BMG111209]